MTPNHVKNLARHVPVALAATLVSCGPSVDPLEDAPPVLAQYAALLHANYEDTASSAEALRTAATPLFSGTPTAADLTAAQTAWRASRVPYSQSEVARFYEGPIDAPDDDYESLLNAWPLDEAAIDYVRATADGEPMYGGLIQRASEFPSIDATLIAERNMVGGEANVTTGYHAVEFLLWGQDFDPDGAGDRPFTDYVPGMEMDAERRRAYLDVATQLLVEQLGAVRDAWAPDVAGNYRAEFEALAPREGLRRILIGMIRLLGGELGSDRIVPAYTEKLQEDEQSCFSDNTNDDMMNDAQGALNVYTGTYRRLDGTTVSGASLSDLVRARDPELDTRVRAALEQLVTDMRGWPTTASCPSAAQQGRCPFDQLITGVDTDPGRMAIWSVHGQLGVLQDLLYNDVAGVLDVSITQGDLGTGE